jgi:hypothetical protein
LELSQGQVETMTAALVGETQERPEMHEKPRLFDDLGLVALPTAINCGRLFTQYTLTNWGASPFVIADAVVVAGELVTFAVQETGILDDEVRWSELDYVNHIVVRLLGFPYHVVIEVWDAATEPAVLPAGEPKDQPTGLHLVDVTARRWGSSASPRGRLMWAELAVYARTESGLPIRPPRPSSRPGAQSATLSAELLRRVRDGLIGL